MSAMTSSGILAMFLRLASSVTPGCPSEEMFSFLRLSATLFLARAAMRAWLTSAMTAVSVGGEDIFVFVFLEMGPYGNVTE